MLPQERPVPGSKNYLLFARKIFGIYVCIIPTRECKYSIRFLQFCWQEEDSCDPANKLGQENKFTRWNTYIHARFVDCSNKKQKCTLCYDLFQALNLYWLVIWFRQVEEEVFFYVLFCSVLMVSIFEHLLIQNNFKHRYVVMHNCLHLRKYLRTKLTHICVSFNMHTHMRI